VIQVVRTTEELNNALADVRLKHQSIGLVPTMGALHDGHLMLVKQSVADNDFTVVTVFVNPTQFNNPDDLRKYPRNLQKDVDMLEAVSCDLVFAPSSDEMYSKEELGKTFDFDFGGLDRVMEGRFRPGHFNGVVQIVSKIFDLIKPDRAYFGEKDFQQLSIIHHMQKVLGYKVEIIDCPIVREPSGLAMSSRNERLTPEQRNIAAGISKVLFECRNFVPQLNPAELKAWVVEQISGIAGLEIEYFEIANVHTLQPVVSWDEPSVGCIAVFCGEVRLIDNIRCS
jgi:pantoate--beta-alanine ligase